MLKLDNVSAAYGDVQVLKKVSLEVPEGRIVALLGPNAAGKSTTLRTISGLVRARAGEIHFDGRPIHRLKPEEIVHLGLIHVPEGRGIYSTLTVRENLTLGAYAPRARARTAETLKWVYGLFPRLEERRDQLGGSLSGGEQQMCAIARGLMALPRLLMIDEMSLGLAPFLVNKMFEVVKQIAQSGITVLLVEQQVNKVLEMAHAAFIMENGVTVMSGPACDIAQNEHVKKVYLGL